MVGGVVLSVGMVAVVMGLFGKMGGMVRLGDNGGGAMRHGIHGRRKCQRHKQRHRRNLPDYPYQPVHPPCSIGKASSARHLAISPRGGYCAAMTEKHSHASHPAIAARLKRAEGHLRHVVAMIEDGKPCLDLATQLHAVERAVAEAKRSLIHDHIDHCLTEGHAHDMAEIKSLTKLL